MHNKWSVLLVLMVLAGCKAEIKPAPAAQRNLDPVVLARGAELFRQHCASCHGDRAQGALNWQRPGADGKYPPPPLDGSAHAWHHPYAALQQTISQGTLRRGGSMPAWGGKLSEADIDAIIFWFQSLWPDPIYAAWADTDRRARTGSR